MLYLTPPPYWRQCRDLLGLAHAELRPHLHQDQSHDTDDLGAKDNGLHTLFVGWDAGTCKSRVVYATRPLRVDYQP